MARRRARLPQRPDATHNREAILRTADEAMVAATSSVPPLHEIARRAGVGRSTAYRYFTDRHELADAVFDRRTRTADDAVTAVLAGERSLRDVLAWMLRTQIEMRPLAAVLRELPPAEQRRYADRALEPLAPAFDYARRHGQLRPDARPGDLLLVLIMIDALAAGGPLFGWSPDDVERMIIVVLDGLFVSASGR